MTVDETILLRLRVEDLLYREAELLDAWQLDDWLALYTDDAFYHVPPTDIDGDTADPETALFYIVDDALRLRERVVRLNKKAAHSEWPRSKLRHLVSNVRAERDGAVIRARSAFAVWRSKDGTSDVFVGHYRHTLVEREGGLMIAGKTCVLDMDALRPHARISIIL
jgi:p-cumate 2,3-dioxygenase beta subunit